jgi:hypothetical protein
MRASCRVVFDESQIMKMVDYAGESVFDPLETRVARSCAGSGYAFEEALPERIPLQKLSSNLVTEP